MVQNSNQRISNWGTEEVVQRAALNHNTSTTSPTPLLGCWAKFRTGLPPFRSGLLDGKCVWRVGGRVPLTPVGIACLDLNSTTSGKTMWPREAVRGLQRPHLMVQFFSPSTINSAPLRQVQSETEGMWQRKPASTTRDATFQIRARL